MTGQPGTRYRRRRHVNPKVKNFLYKTGDFLVDCLVGAYLGHIIVMVLTGP